MMVVQLPTTYRGVGLLALFDKTNNPEFSKKLRGIINDLYDLSDYYKKDKKTKKDWYIYIYQKQKERGLIYLSLFC